MRKIGFIGTGNMGKALFLAVSKVVDCKDIYLSNRTAEKCASICEQSGANFSTNTEIAKMCNYIFLCVKPQMLKAVTEEIKDALSERSDEVVLVSPAAGVKTETLMQMAGKEFPIIRIMPNTPVSVGEGLTLITKNAAVSDEQMNFFKDILKFSGAADEIPENMIDAASAISGCGPAFLYMFAESLADGGVECGLSKQKALLYAVKTIIGSAKLIDESGLSPSVLKDNVTSPGGSTIRGVHALEKGNFRNTVMNSVVKAYERTKELGKQ